MMKPNDDCFCDLAPLYSLDVLDEEERRLVEAELAEFPELAEELANLESTVAALAYSAPPIEMSANLKDRLFQNLDLEPPELPEVPPSLPMFFVARSQEIEWRPFQAPGVFVKILYQNETTREVVGMLRAEAGARYPLHRHTAMEEIYMLEGDLAVGEVVYGAGDYLRSDPGSEHAPTTRDGCMFFFRASMDNEYLE
jgi:anti-sigma factor ChrR (cupin superfamily)